MLFKNGTHVLVSGPHVINEYTGTIIKGYTNPEIGNMYDIIPDGDPDIIAVAFEAEVSIDHTYYKKLEVQLEIEKQKFEMAYESYKKHLADELELEIEGLEDIIQFVEDTNQRKARLQKRVQRIRDILGSTRRFK